MEHDSWNYVPVSSIAEIYLGGTPSRSVSEYWNGDIKWASAKDIAESDARYIFDAEETITRKGLQKSAAKLLDRDTIVITARGTVGAIRMLGTPMSFNQTCYGLVAKDFVVPNFLYYGLKAGIDDIKSLSYGTIFDTITKKTFDSLLIHLPPLLEQCVIAGILGVLDDKIELNHRMNATLESMAKAVFRQWFVEGENVKNLEEVSLPEIIEVNPSRSLKKGEIASYLDMANMPTQGHRGIDWVDRPYGSGTKFINGDTLLARITPCLEKGKTAFVDFLKDGEVGWGSTEYIVFRPRPPLPHEYGYYLARTEELRSHAIQNMTGTSGRQRTPASCFDSFMIVKPPIELAKEFGEFAKSVIEKIKGNDEESRTLARLRDSLLPKLMRGEVRVKLNEEVNHG